MMNWAHCVIVAGLLVSKGCQDISGSCYLRSEDDMFWLWYLEKL